MNLDVPDWLRELTEDAIKMAEKYVKGPGKGPIKFGVAKQAIKAIAKARARAHDIPQIPDWFENTAEPLGIDLLVETAFAGLKASGVLQKIAEAVGR